MRWREESEPHAAEVGDTTGRRSSSLDEDEADSSSPDGHPSNPEKMNKHPPRHSRLEATPDIEDEDDGDADRLPSTDPDKEKQHKEIKEESDPPDKDDDGADHAEEPPHVPWKPQNIQSTCEFTHTITNYSQQRESGCKKAEYSETTVDEFGNRWRLIIYVNGNGRASNHHLSLFLQVADADDLPFGWKKAVSYVLTLEHPKGGSFSYAKRNPDKTFKLCPKAIDWGWSQFITSDRIQQEGFVSEDSLTVRASVTVKSSSVCIDEDDAELYLKCAVEEGGAEAVKLCLEQGASVNCKFKDDLYTPLHTACSSGTTKGSVEVLNLLLEEGADPNACNKWRETPLLIAANNGHFAACEALLGHGADPSLCSEAGWSALTFAAHKGYDDIVKLLLKKDAPVNTRVAEDNSTPLHKACAGSKPGHLSSVKLLIERDADVHALNKWRETPLLTAANHGQAASVKLLLQARADPCKCTDTGWSPLSIAAYKGHDEVVRLLLEEGAPTEEEDPTLSALLQAATKGLPDTVELLLKNGADHTVTTKKGDTALSILVEQNLIDAAVEMVTQYSASIPRCSRDRKKVQRARLLINLRMKQLEREGKHHPGSTDEDESDVDGSLGSHDSQHEEDFGEEASKPKKKKEQSPEATCGVSAEEKARAAEEALLLELELEDAKAKREEAEANSKRAKKKKKKEQLRQQKLKDEEDRRHREEMEAKEREKITLAKKRKEMEVKEQEKREQEIKDMIGREKALAVKRKEREHRERLQLRQREEEASAASPSGSESSEKWTKPAKTPKPANLNVVGTKKSAEPEPSVIAKKTTPVGRKVAPLGGNRRWETKPKSPARPTPPALSVKASRTELAPSLPNIMTTSRSEATASIFLTPRPSDPLVNGKRNGEATSKRSSMSEVHMNGPANGPSPACESKVEHPAVSLFRREKVLELIRQCSTSVNVSANTIKRAIYRWVVRAAHDKLPFVDSIIPSWKDLNKLVAHFQRQFIAEGRRGASGNGIEVLKEAGTSVALICQGLASEVEQFRLRIEGHVPLDWTDAAIEMTCVEKLGADGGSLASLSWANHYTVQIPSYTLASLRDRYLGPPHRFFATVFVTKIWYETRGHILADTGMGLRIPPATQASLASQAAVTAEMWSDPFSVHGQNMFWGWFEEVDRFFGGQAPVGKEELTSGDVLACHGGSVSVLPPLDNVIASQYMNRILDILVTADRTGTPVSFAIFLHGDCFLDLPNGPTPNDLGQLDPRLLDARGRYIQHVESLPAGQHEYHYDDAPVTSDVSRTQSLFVLMQNESGKSHFIVTAPALQNIVTSMSVVSPVRSNKPVVTPLGFHSDFSVRDAPLSPQPRYLDGLAPISPDPHRFVHSEFGTIGGPAIGKPPPPSFDPHSRLSRHGRLFELVDDGEDDHLNEVDLVSGMLNNLDVGLFQNGTLSHDVDIEAISLMGIGVPPLQSSRAGNALPGRFG